MVFPKYDANGGTVYLVDNFRLDEGEVVTPPDSGDVALAIFDDALVAEWAPWPDSNATPTITLDDAEHDMVVQLVPATP
jgi:hypothetical protein